MPHARRIGRRSFSLAAVALIAPSLVLTAATAAHAAVVVRYVSTNGDDTGPNGCTSSSTPCKTIQQAVAEANAGDTVSIAAGSYPESVLVRKSLTFLGAGVATTTVTGNGSDAALFVDGIDTDVPPSVTAHNLSMSGVEVAAADAALSDVASDGTSGPGLAVDPGSNVTATAASFSNNVGDGVEMASSGTLMMTAVAIDHNGQTGVLVSSGTVSITHSDISGNAVAGVVSETGDTPATVTLDRDSLDRNGGAGTVAQPGGTINILRSAITRTEPRPDSSYGGGALALGGTVNVAESTIDANTAFGVEVHEGIATVTASTISGTQPAADATLAGALAVDNATNTAADLTVTGTILDANQVPDCNGPKTDLGYNLISDRSCGTPAGGTRVHTSAHLGTLGFHGGPSQTRLPGRASAALNAIPVGKAACVKGVTDQRGAKRPDGITHRCDIGAVEQAIRNPKIHATLRSKAPHAHGVYQGAVKVSFVCHRGSAPLVKPCPKAVRIHKSGRHHLTKRIHAVDGGRARVSVRFTIRRPKG